MHDRKWNDETKAKLTEKEIEYAEAFMQTKSIRMVAARLGVTKDHARTKLKDIEGKTGIRFERQTRSRSEAGAKDLFMLLKEQKFRCALSGVKLLPETAALDHIIPVSRGGSDAIDNLQWVDCRINKMKGSMVLEEFLDLCSKVSQWQR